jgi:cyclopropane-fatty-acyl-phospholipid synthase
MLLARLFNSFLHRGTLTVIDADGKAHTFGDGEAPAVTIRFHDKDLQRRIYFSPQLAIGEAYMDGSLTIEDGEIYDFLALALSNMGWGNGHWLQDVAVKLRSLFRWVQQYNPVPVAQRNVAHHYDLSDELYDLFLDSDRQYSCAYYLSPNDSLEQAQEQKKCHLAAKLLLRPGARVLDIGSGWGGLALYLADNSGTDVTGVTLSKEQVEVARQRAAEKDLAERVRFHLRDYREETASYDRIVSVGMFEHVGVPHYGTFFKKVRDLLKDDGVALLHTIGRAEGPGPTNRWLTKYIFPGGYTPALSEVLPVIERTGLYVTDIEVLRLHYAETLKEWRRRFNANRAHAAEIYDERFCRMWEFYLAACEAVFRYAGQVVFQIQMAKRQDAVPLTRDYITDWERAQTGRRSAAA